MKPAITVSINPTYYCNFRCSFCYLSDQQLGQSKLISFEILEKRLQQISEHFEIVKVDLYGGEIGLMKMSDLLSIKNIIRRYSLGTINAITNGSVLNPFFLDPEIELTISWDFLAREKHDKVYQNMQQWEKPLHILSLASDLFCSMSDRELSTYLDKINSLPNVQSLEIKPYSSNLYHQQKVTYLDFESIVQKIIQHPIAKKFLFVNEEKIKNSIRQNSNAWSDDHIYITPEGDFSVLEFDSEDREFFQKIESIQEYQNWTRLEKQKVLTNIYCSSCEYLGRCLSEHLKPVKSIEQSCNGFYRLLNWYANEKL